LTRWKRACATRHYHWRKWYYAGPQEFVPDQISQAIDQAVANKVTGIVLHGQSPETAAAVDNAIAAGIPVIIVNTDIPSNRLSFLGCNPYQAGYDMGERWVSC
jgi:ABC-type sugar transport system substrate-binding protein